MLDINQINDLIQCLKRIINENTEIVIPQFGEKDKIELKSSKYLFIVDLNRKGHKKPKCTFQLREQQHKDLALLRLDLVGREHENPPGDYPLAGQVIPCPHIHIAHPEFGSSIAFPLDDPYVRMFLTEDELKDLALVLKKFLERCNVGNIDDYKYYYNLSLFIDSRR
jgi:hypothetical protein